MKMPNRYGSESNGKYRFGFQGQEADDEVASQDGSFSNFKFRMSDNRIGKFLSIDPLEASYPWNSPYAFSENRVIDGIELEGAEYKSVKHKVKEAADGTLIIISTSVTIEKDVRFFKSDGIIAYARTDVSFEFEDGSIAKGKSLLEPVDNITTVEIDFHKPSALYDYTQNVIEGKATDDLNYTFDYDREGTMIGRELDLMIRDLNAPDNAKVTQDLEVLSATAIPIVGKTSRQARRDVMRKEGIPTSQQPSKQTTNKSGRNLEYEVPKVGGGKQTKGVQQKTLDDNHGPHWEGGSFKKNGQIDRHGTKRLDNSKSKSDYDG